jgi:hypothetical protein
MVAVTGGHKSTAVVLVEAGCDVNAQNKVIMMHANA